MVRLNTLILAILATSSLLITAVRGQEAKQADSAKAAVPMALLPFQERGKEAKEAKELGARVTDLLFAKLATNSDLFMVEREVLDALHKEQQVNLSGLVTPDQATRVGHLTGAKVIVTGSVLQVDKDLYLIAKVIGVETSRVLGASAKGSPTSSLDDTVAKLAKEIAKTVVERSDVLIAPPVTQHDRIAAIKKALGDRGGPTLYIDIAEQHIGRTTLDPAVATEIGMLCKQAGFTILDSTEDKNSADVVIKGEGFSEFAARNGELVSVKARLEIKAVGPKTGKLLAVDRQTAIAIDLSEQLAGRTALAEAAGGIAERLLPQIVKQYKTEDTR